MFLDSLGRLVGKHAGLQLSTMTLKQQRQQFDPLL